MLRVRWTRVHGAAMEDREIGSRTLAASQRTLRCKSSFQEMIFNEACNLQHAHIRRVLGLRQARGQALRQLQNRGVLQQ